MYLIVQSLHCPPPLLLVSFQRFLYFNLGGDLIGHLGSAGRQTSTEKIHPTLAAVPDWWMLSLMAVMCRKETTNHLAFNKWHIHISGQHQSRQDKDWHSKHYSSLALCWWMDNILTHFCLCCLIVCKNSATIRNIYFPSVVLPDELWSHLIGHYYNSLYL